MKRFILFLVSLLAGLTVFWIITLQVGWQEVIEPLFLLDAWKILGLLLVTFLIVISNVFKWQFVLKVLGFKVKIRDIFGPWLAGFTLNYLTPIALLGGEVAMISGLKEKYPKISLIDNIASVVIIRILNFSTTILVVVLGLFLFLGKVSSLPEDISLALTLFMLSILGILAFFYYRSFKKESIISWLTRLLERVFGIEQDMALKIEARTFSFFQKSDLNMWKGLGLSLFVSFLSILRSVLITFFITNSWLTFSEILSINAFANLAYIAALPATFGSLEAAEVFAFSFLGLSTASGTTFSLILRFTEISAVLLGFPFLLRMWLALNLKLWQNANLKLKGKSSPI